MNEIIKVGEIDLTLQHSDHDLINNDESAKKGMSIDILNGITDSIKQHKQQIEKSYIEIGRLLCEAQEGLKHGLWSKWLKRSVDMSESTARRFMRIYKECKKQPALTDLGFCKICEILTLPEDEREAFASESHNVNGEEKSVSEMSTRELKSAVKEHVTQHKTPVSIDISSDDKSEKIKGANVESNKRMFHEQMKFANECIDNLLMAIKGSLCDDELCSDMCRALHDLCSNTLKRLDEIKPSK